MAVLPGSKILAAEYNSLQSNIERILGTGVGSIGYGQPVSSTAVGTSSTVTVEHLANARKDLETMYRHQTGNNIPLAVITSDDLIAADAASGNTTKGLNDYLDLVTVLETNRFDVHPSQLEINPNIIDDTRMNSWSRITITSELSLRFQTANARRHFFNAGGQIRFSGKVEHLDAGSPSYLRNLGWQNIIENPGIIIFDRNSIKVTNAGAMNISYPNGTDYGNERLTNSYVEIFRKKAAGAVYADSYWSIEARTPTSSSIRFRMKMVDNGPESNLDGTAQGSVYGGVKEPVTADITMRYGGCRPSDAVDLPFPRYSIVNRFQ